MWCIGCSEGSGPNALTGPTITSATVQATLLPDCASPDARAGGDCRVVGSNRPPLPPPTGVGGGPPGYGPPDEAAIGRLLPACASPDARAGGDCRVPGSNRAPTGGTPPGPPSGCAPGNCPPDIPDPGTNE